MSTFHFPREINPPCQKHVVPGDACIEFRGGGRGAGWSWGGGSAPYSIFFDLPAHPDLDRLIAPLLSGRPALERG